MNELVPLPQAAPDAEGDAYDPEFYGGAAFDPDRGVVGPAAEMESPEPSHPAESEALSSAAAADASEPEAEPIVSTLLAEEIPLELDAEAARHAFATPADSSPLSSPEEDAGLSISEAPADSAPEIQRQTMAYRPMEPEDAPEQKRPLPWGLLIFLFVLVVLGFAWNEATAEWDASGNMIETNLFRRFHVLRQRIKGTYDPQATIALYERIQRRIAGSKAAAVVRQVRGSFPHKLVMITSTPEGAEISLNGTHIGTTPYAGEAELSAGTYRVTLTKKGYRDLTRELEVKDSEEEIRLELKLTPAGKPSGKGAHPDNDREAGSGTHGSKKAAD